MGLEEVRRIVAAVKAPLVAIGGIDLSNMAELKAVGIRSVAMVRAFQSDTAEAVRRVNQLFLATEGNAAE